MGVWDRLDVVDRLVGEDGQRGERLALAVLDLVEHGRVLDVQVVGHHHRRVHVRDGEVEEERRVPAGAARVAVSLNGVDFDFGTNTSAAFVYYYRAEETVKNKRFFDLILCSSSTQPKASDTLPAQRCASSAKAISNSGILGFFCASAINGDD